MMKKLLVLAALVASVTAQGANDWITVGEHADGTLYQAQKNSGVFVRTIGGLSVYKVNMQTVYAGRATLYQTYVKLHECAAGYGELTFLDMAGRFRFNVEYNLASDTIGSAEARVICGAGEIDAAALQKESKARNDSSI